MKAIPAALLAHYETNATAVAYALLIERADGQLFGFTSHDRSFALDITPWGYTGQTAFQFGAAQGFDASTFVTSSGLAVDNLVLTTLNDSTLFQPQDLLAGRWRAAKFRIFRYRWDVSPVTITDHVETMVRGWFGEITLRRNSIAIELRSISQLLQQPVGSVSQKTCRVRLGSIGVGKCNVDLAPFTFALAVTSVTDKSNFVASGALQADDYFGEGEIFFETGENEGLAFKVKSFSSGAFELALPTPFDINVGDTFTAIAGCRKRLLEDCKAKFNNVLNFQGEFHRPTADSLLKT